MNRTEQIYIELISNFLNDDNKNIEFSNVDESQLIDLCKNHKNVGLVYVAIKEQKKAPKNLIKIFEQGFYTEMMAYSKKTTTFQIVLEELNKNGIKHIILKGMSYAKCYRQSELRTMGDMDLIISHKDMEEVDRIMEKMGAELKYERSNEKVHFYKINKYVVEIHTSAGYVKYFNQHYDYESYFKKAINGSVCIKDYTYEFLPYYKIMYTIFHTAKHFYDSGCGVRMMTDLTVLINFYRNEFDINKMWSELEEMGLKKFASGLFRICGKWFGLKVDGLNYEMENIKLVEDYILSGGVYGHNNLADMGQITHQSGNNTFFKTLKWAFPSYRNMREYSNWFKDKPAILLPMAYIERAIRNAKERGGIVLWLKSLKKENEEKRVQSNIVKIMGLGNE